MAWLLFVPMAFPADGVGTLRIKPGWWQERTQIWIDGKEVLSALAEAERRANAEIRAQLPLVDREAFDREAAAAPSLSVEGDCVAPEESQINARAALEQMMRSLHQPPWNCSTRDERASSNGFEYRFNCSTSAGARAEGQAKFQLRSAGEFRATIEGMSHAIDNGTGKPMSPSMLPVRSLHTGQWISAQCRESEEQGTADQGE